MAVKADSEATYWQAQITKAEGDKRLMRWHDLAQRFYDRYLLMSDDLAMSSGAEGVGKRMTYNLLWSNTETLQPMLYSRMPEPYFSRKFNNRDPIARMAATIGERVTSSDMEEDDLDDQAECCVLDYAITGRGTLRAIYDSTVVNSRVPVRQENREDGSPAFFMDDGTEIPPDDIVRDAGRFFGMDSQITNERAPILHHNWKDFLIGPGRNWKEVQKRGWIDWKVYMTKAHAAERFGQDVADALTYDVNPFDVVSDKQKTTLTNEKPSSLEMLARVDEIWDAKSRTIYWVSEGYPRLLDKEPDYLDLKGFYNTPRPLLATTGTDSLVPVPDYAEYFSQAKELDEITVKIEQIMEEVRAAGVYDGSQPGLGVALKNKRGGWTGVQDWANFLQKGGTAGTVQLLPLQDLIQAVISLYEHREKVLSDSDRISGMIDLFRGQETQADETLGQSNMRKSMGGLRINKKQRDFQRYMRDILSIKAEIITSKFDRERILQMADLPALMNESPEIARVMAMVESNPQAMQDPQVAMQARMAFQQAQQKQMAVIQGGLALLKDDRMRTFRLDIETDATVAVDEMADREAAEGFVTTVGTFINQIGDSPAMQQPGMKELAADMLLFIVRRWKVGRSLEQKIETVLQNLATQPPPEQPPDPLMLEVQRRAQDDQMDYQLGQQKNQIALFQAQIDQFKAVTERQKAQSEAMEAAKDGTRADLELANEVLDSDALEMQEPNGAYNA